MKTPIALSLAALSLTAASPASAAPAAPGLKLWRMDCGAIEVRDLNAFSDAFQYSGQKKTLTNSCYLIQHGETYMLWDTGFPKTMQNAPLGDEVMAPTFKTTVVDQLKEIGATPDKISIVGASHNHFDHVGQAADFPGATLLIGKADLDEFKSPTPPPPVMPALIDPWLDGKSRSEPVTGDKDVFGDGSVIMFATPGHTHDSHALLLRLNETGPVILSGDAVHFEEQFANRGVPPFNADRAETLASMDRLTTMAANLKATVIVQHDAGDITKLPVFPTAAE